MVRAKTKRYAAVILAGDRGHYDPVANAAGVSHKCLVPVNGTPMVLRVLEALKAAREIDDRILCGPPQAAINQNPDLKAQITSGKVRWMESSQTPSASAHRALESLPEESPVLVTTADHALLSAQMVDHFCVEARLKHCDVVVGLAPLERVLETFPDAKRTASRFQDGSYCSCNLFAFLSPRARAAADFWRKVEHQRKKPIRLVSILGWSVVLRYLLRRLSLTDALAQISGRLQLRAGAVFLPFPEAAIDVDKVEDWELVQKHLAARKASRPLGTGHSAHHG
jgi:CTP:molybdopterin cytidylyltransferase MocA